MTDPWGPVPGDAFGAGLLAYLDDPSPEHATVVERDDGCVDHVPTWLFFRAEDEFFDVESGFFDHVRGDVLDIGAGAGPHALALLERGHRVTALDTSAGAIEVCTRRGIEDVFRGTVDEYAAGTDRRYDTFLLMGHNLGLLEGRTRAPQLLGAIRGLANPGAVILGTIGDVYVTELPVHLAYHEQNRIRGRLAGQVTMRVRYADLATDWFDYLYASLEEVTELVAGTGWSVRHDESDGFTLFVVLELV